MPDVFCPETFDSMLMVESDVEEWFQETLFQAAPVYQCVSSQCMYFLYSDEIVAGMPSPRGNRLRRKMDMYEALPSVQEDEALPP
jgi:hypothetical protein